MSESMLNFWLYFGIFLVISEFLLPGLVSVFVGLGALTVAALLHYGYIHGLPAQLITWFVSSTIYIFSLRLLVIRFYPSDREIQEIDEDKMMIGQIATVTKEISQDASGSIAYADSTWVAVCDQPIALGEKVQIVSRDNITITVKPVTNKEST